MEAINGKHKPRRREGNKQGQTGINGNWRIENRTNVEITSS